MHNKNVQLAPSEAQLGHNFTFTVRKAINCKTHGGYGICNCGPIKKVIKKHNLVVTVGRAVIAQRLAGDNTNSLNIDFGELGTGSTAPANGDTALETPTFRKATASATDATNQAFVSFFMTAAEAIGTHAEFGTFIDGTITIGTGVLFSRVLVSIIKAATETLTIDVTYTVT